MCIHGKIHMKLFDTPAPQKRTTLAVGVYFLEAGGGSH